MAGNIKVRENYLNDAIRLRRIRDAVKKDPRPSEEWKGEVIAHLNAVITSFLSPTIGG